MLRNRCWSLIAIVALAGASNAAKGSEILPQKTAAGRFTVKAGTAGQQALDLMNQFQYLEAPIRPLERLGENWPFLPLVWCSNYLCGELHPRIDGCLDQVLEFAQREPKDADVASALIFFSCRVSPRNESDCAYQKAQRILIDNHLNHPSIGIYAKHAAHPCFNRQAIALTHQIYENHTDPAVRAMTKTTLASLYRNQAEWVRYYQSESDKVQGRFIISGPESQDIINLMKIGEKNLMEKSRKYE